METVKDGKLFIHMEAPAEDWRQALLLGNGFMGQAVLGGPECEEVELSHIAFFSGADGENPYREEASRVFEEMRRAACEEDFEGLTGLTERYMGVRGNYGTNLPVGKLLLQFESGTADKYEDYKRSLDLEKGLARTEFRRKGVKYGREAFTSHPDQVFALLLTDESAEGMSLRISFDAGGLPCETGRFESALSFHVKALETLHSDGAEGVALTGMVCVQTADGAVSVTDGEIQVRGAHRAVLWLSMETNFPALPGEKTEVDPGILYRRVNRAPGDYETVRERHIRDVACLMGRQRLCLEGDASAKLTELMYQYGRYLMVCSSREDSPLPAPLQGVWNDDVACRIGWTCDMHLDINTQMNYWLSEAGNLRECHKPVFRWMEERLIPNGRKTARRCYGRPGWAAELVSNAWGYAAPYWHKSLSPCPTGGAWLASDYMEHYRYGGDPGFLAEHAYPVLREAAEFFLAYLFEDRKGGLTCGPSISPENAFIKDGEKYYASNGCTYEVLMIRELFDEYLEAWEALKKEFPRATEWGEEENFPRRVREARDRLPPYRVLSDGTLAEWAHDYPTADPQHRHTSHLLGLFPYWQITPRNTPELALAAERTIAAKLTPYANWEDTGWARALLALYNARLERGEEACRHLRSMQETLTGPNLLVMHPPTRGAASFREVYELDGNTGFSMAVLEMLVQSHGGVIRLLPALPEAWPDGRLEGVLVRGGVCLDMEWRDGKPVNVSAVTVKSGDYVFAWGDRKASVYLEAGHRTPVLEITN